MKLFGQIALLLIELTLFAAVGRAQTFTVLHDFSGNSDGNSPYGAPVVDSAGNVYGTTGIGGVDGLGTVFEINTAGTETILVNFDGPNGIYSFGPLLLGARDNLYGNTWAGGFGGNGCDGLGGGVIFQLSSSGNFTVLHNFNPETEGFCSWSGLIEDKSGNLYGTTLFGGTHGYGTVFKLDNNGILTVLHSFGGGAKDGAYPYNGVILDAEDNLYGVTPSGGGSEYGIVYRISSKGKFTLLHSFTGWKTDGCEPMGTLVMDQNKNLYGTTTACGSSGIGSGNGTIFKIDARGHESLLHSFLGRDGGGPTGSLFLDQAGNLYGTTQYGGSPGGGTVYQLSKGRQLTILHNFTGGDDGRDPYGGVTNDAAGNLYGTSTEGGTDGDGSVWKITP